jgi:hypothetical protein
MSSFMENIIKTIGAKKIAVAISAFACAAMFSFGWSEQGGISLSIQKAQAQPRVVVHPHWLCARNIGERRGRHNVRMPIKPQNDAMGGYIKPPTALSCAIAAVRPAFFRLIS